MAAVTFPPIITPLTSPFLSPTSSPSSLFINPLLRPSQRLVRVTPTSRPSLIVRAMRAVIQRVSSASVEVEGRIVSEIGSGFLVLIGVHDSDTHSDADYICRKVLNMRLFPNEKTGKSWDHSVMHKNYEVLLVSQFTLYGTLKGNKPDFHVAMAPQRAKPFYESLVEKFRKSYKPELIKDGVFGAKMKVNLVNDGPVTFQLDSSQSSNGANTKCSSDGETLPKPLRVDEANEQALNEREQTLNEREQALNKREAMLNEKECERSIMTDNDGRPLE